MILKIRFLRESKMQPFVFGGLQQYADTQNPKLSYTNVGGIQ